MRRADQRPRHRRLLVALLIALSAVAVPVAAAGATHTRLRSGTPKKMHSTTPKKMHSATQKKMHSAAPKKMHSAAQKKMHSAAPKKMQSAAPKAVPSGSAGVRAIRRSTVPAPGSPPNATLTVPLISGTDTCNTCLSSNTIAFLQSGSGAPVTVRVDATPAPGATVVHIVLEYAPAGTSSWTPLNNVAFSPTAPYQGQLSYNSFPSFPALEGDFDLRVAVTDSAGQTGYSPPVRNVVVDDDYYTTYVGMQNPGQAFGGSVSLLAAPEASGAAVWPDTVTFQISPSGQNSWRPIGSPVAGKTDAQGNQVTDPYGQPEYTTTLDTTNPKLPDGSYDLRVQAQDANGDAFVGNEVSVTVDNTAPTVTLANPAAPLSGVTPISATASDSGSGVASVKFQEAPSGSGAWSTIGLASSPPYKVNFDTRALQSGVYDLRAVATDLAGNAATSVLTGISIENSTGPASTGNFAVTDTVVPANGGTGGSTISLLGEIRGSSEHETWAYGYTSAPPATVNGSPLPYTAAPGTPQLVLLRYTDNGGWQISDVLRNPGGTPFAVPANPLVYGQMTPSGEAWMVVAGNGTASVFHRQPGGQFVLDPGATSALQPVLSNVGGTIPLQLHLGQTSDGTVYGLLVNPSQHQVPQVVNNGGSPTQINTALQYGELVNGSWTVSSAPVPSEYQPTPGDTLTLTAGSPTGPGAGWGEVAASANNPNPQPLLLGSFDSGGWQFASSTGLDALDLTGNFAVGNVLRVHPLGIMAGSDGVWIKARLDNFSGESTIVALYDPATGRVTQSWCASAVAAESFGCASVLDANRPATLPDAVFDTPQGPVALALGNGFVDSYANGVWSSVAAPGFIGGGANVLFTDPTDGWLAGSNSVGQITAKAPASALAEWPQPNQATLVSTALPPGGAGTGTSGALAVGLNGTTLHYDSSAGWLVDPVPQRARNINLLGVAFDGSSKAVAVGSLGTILDWDGTSWSADPQSVSVTENQLNAVAFGTNGQGWAVGTFGTILHYDGTSWSPEQIDAADSGTNVTSVAVAGSQAFAVAGGNLITRQADGTWKRVDPTQLPAGLPSGSLTLVSGLPDGGVVAAGKSVLIVRENPSSNFAYSAQPIEGIAVALTAFRDADSQRVRAFVSVAPPAIVAGNSSNNVAGFPPGDGELLVQTDSGWNDLSRAQYPVSGGPGATPGDGAPEPDPVLAVASSADGRAAWAVGGYAGTQTASGLGSSQPLQGRPFAWQTASIWRYDQGGPATAPSITQAQTSLPAQANTVSFAFFSGAECAFECSQVQDAQPGVNLSGASAEIANFASQPGGPAFAMLGGNAVGPTDLTGLHDGNGAVDLANLHKYLSPLGSVPLYAAYGPLDAVPTSGDPSAPWSDAFAQSPAPFGLTGEPAGITQVGSGGHDGSVNHYYSFDVAQNGGTLRVIVLDNSAGSLDPTQNGWLQGQLAAAQGMPTVVVTSQPLASGLAGSPYQAGSATDADQVATELANAGVLAVFTTSATQSDQEHLIPTEDPNAPPTGQPQIPEYEGASLGYQQTQNNGVLWYFVSVDTVNRTVSVQGIPVVQSLALEPLAGLSVARSSTLSFRAVGRRPPGTLAATADQTNPQGYANYVSIPSPSCSGCVAPSYTFTSSDPGVGDFVKPSGPGSQFPALNSAGKPVRSSTSGLFCGYNAGTTTVSVTSGLLTSSQTVTVQPGPIGQPCGTVAYAPDENVVTVARRPIFKTSTAGVGGSAPPPPPAAQALSPVLPKILLTPPAPPLAVKPAPPRPAIHPLPAPPPALPASTFAPQPAPSIGIPTLAVPLVPPGVTPVPPGGATVSAQATARREEKARKEASQSAFVTRPAGTSATDWFYPAVGVVGIFAVILAAAGMRPGPRRKPALAQARLFDDPRRRRRTR